MEGGGARQIKERRSESEHLERVLERNLISVPRRN